MRVPLEWLHEFCAPALGVRALEERLTMTGTKVEAVHHHGVGDAERFVVGRVLEARRHPDADRLSVCTVDIGGPEASQIVCGAPNVATGQTVAVARPGAVMPDGTRLGAAKLRGVRSEGMILAEDELAIGTDHAGIIVLPEDGPRPGQPLADVLPIATEVLELEITPNRPDCLGIYGVAREVHAATGAPLAPPPWRPLDLPPTEAVDFELRAPELVPRITFVAFDGVRIGPSPAWLKARLMACGQRPINNVVDITNYVMFLTGQPLHAFDLDRIAGGRLVLRRAHDGEGVETLDGQTRRLDGEMLLFEDAEGPTSIAGIMGGARSEVEATTTRVLMEVATWDGPNINRTSGALGLRTEASGRFEKGLQPEQTLEAQAVALELMASLCGATARGLIDVGAPPPPLATLRLREARVAGLLGRAIPRPRQAEILDALEFATADAPDGLDVTVPAFRRADVTREADLVEEVARVDGLDQLPATLPARRGAIGRLSRPQRLRRRAQDALVGRGMHEVVGWSFTTPELHDRLRLPADDARRQAVRLENPMSEDQSELRTTLLGSLLDAARHNVARGTADLALFESGGIYRDDREGTGSVLPTELHALGGVLVGRLAPPTWTAPDPPRASFFAAKGLLAAVLDALRVPWAVERAPEPFLHPGRSAAVLVAGRRVGWLGEVHPLVARVWDLDGPCAFEVDLGTIVAAAPAVERHEDLVSFPAVRQDLAVVVREAVPAADVVAAVREAGTPLLERAQVFDVYALGEGRRSLALHLEFRAAERTLTDEEVAEVRERIVDALRARVGAELRA